MSAQSWSVKGIDPKVREAVREAAARQGLSLGEYLNQALQQQEQLAGNGGGALSRRPRSLTSHEEMEDWLLTAPQDMTRPNSDPTIVSHRLDAIERRTQLAVTGLDRAVSTIDRSVFGLAGRVDDAELIARESATRVVEALEQFRQAGEAVSARLNEAEEDARRSRALLEASSDDVSATRQELLDRFVSVEEIARNAERDALNLSRSFADRAAAIEKRIDLVDHDSKGAIRSGLAEARAAAETAAREAAEASTGAIQELRSLQALFETRIADSEDATRRTIDRAIENAQTAHEALADRVARSEGEFRRAHHGLVERIAGVENTARRSVEDAVGEVRDGQTQLNQRIEKVEHSSREATAGLRQAAGAAIADLRNAQLGLAARVKLVEETRGPVDLTEVHALQRLLEDRLRVVETRVQSPVDLGEVYANQATLSERIAQVEARAANPELAERIARLETRPAPVDMEAVLARVEARLAEVSGGGDPALGGQVQELSARLGAQEHTTASVQQAARTFEESLQRLAERIAETESTANTAIRTLEETVSSLGARVAADEARKETENLRAMLEQRLDDMSQRVTDMVQDARSEFAASQSGAGVGNEDLDSLEGSLADVNRRVAAAERRQAQTIEAISIEIKRMSETIDRRLRAVETRSGDGVGAAVSEEVVKLARALETRFEEIERREAAAFDRMGLEVGRLSERLDDRFATAEARSAQAIEAVGEQVARMAERFNQRHEALNRDIDTRLTESDQRAGNRIAEAMANIMQRISEVEEHSVEAVTPVARAMTSVATRLQALEDGADQELSTSARRTEDEPQATPNAPSLFGEPDVPLAQAEADDDYFDLPEDDEPLAPVTTAYAAPLPQEPPVRAAPILPTPAPAPQTATPPPADDLSFDAEDEITDEDEPPIDDDPFWAPASDEPAVAEQAAAPEAEEDLFELDDEALPAAPAAPGRQDYLAAARRAAQERAAAGQPRKAETNYATQSYSLRGSSRVVLWGAAGAIALLVAGGAFLMNRAGDHNSAEPEAAPPLPAPTQSVAPAHSPFDEAVPADGEATAPVDPAAAAPLPAPEATPFAEAAPTHAAPIAPTPAAAPATAQRPPVAAAAPVASQTASARPAGAAAQATAVAAPLAPRSQTLENAAAGGNAVAQYELALRRLSSGRPADAVTLLRQAANQNLAMAQYRLAKLYERGEGVPADLSIARQWTERAAAAGNRRAMHDLGVYFARGEGAPLDEAAAFRWFRQAAELGVADSQYNLGVLYQQGRGVAANPSEALFWFMIASRQGDGDAGARATALEAGLTQQQTEQARARAEAFRPRAASARANGEFGPRPWATPAAAAATATPRAAQPRS